MYEVYRYPDGRRHMEVSSHRKLSNAIIRCVEANKAHRQECDVKRNGIEVVFAINAAGEVVNHNTTNRLADALQNAETTVREAGYAACKAMAADTGEAYSRAMTVWRAACETLHAIRIVKDGHGDNARAFISSTYNPKHV